MRILHRLRMTWRTHRMPWRPSGRRPWQYGCSNMPARAMSLEIEGREVVITNPDKIFFPRTGHTKLDLVNYYLAVADGAVRGVDGPPMAMKRFVNGAED